MSKAAVFKKMKNFKEIRGHHTKAMRQLNDSYIESSTVVQILATIDHSDAIDHDISVPGAGFPVVVQRTTKEMRRIIKKAISRREYEKAIVLLVSSAEDYLFSYSRLILRAYPDRVDPTAKGSVGISVLFKDLIEKGSAVVVEEQIHNRLLNASYGSPEKYTTFIGSVLKGALHKDAMEKFGELKASRDLIVHAQSTINEIYITKVGKLARGKDKDQLPVDEVYFKSAIRTIKRVYASIYRLVLKKYGNDLAVSAAIKRHRI
jgi:hypothetical protein